MGLLSTLFGSYQTKADCDRAIAKQQELIAYCQESIARYRGSSWSNDTKKRNIADKQSDIARHKAEIARIRGIKAGLPK